MSGPPERELLKPLHPPKLRKLIFLKKERLFLHSRGVERSLAAFFGKRPKVKLTW